MEDLNINEKPYKKGDKIIIEVEITDVDKSFDFLGKAVIGKLDTSEFGFDVQKIIFSKDKYVEFLSSELRTEITNNLQKSINNINEVLEVL